MLLSVGAVAVVSQIDEVAVCTGADQWVLAEESEVFVGAEEAVQDDEVEGFFVVVGEVMEVDGFGFWEGCELKSYGKFSEHKNYDMM